MTASEVRKRLQQHYGRQETKPVIRINLPVGSYIPEFIHPPERGKATPLQRVFTAAPLTNIRKRPLVSLGILFAVLTVAESAIFWTYAKHAKIVPSPSLPWSAMFHSANPTHLVTSDPNIAEIERSPRTPISVSEYASRDYIYTLNNQLPTEDRFRHMMRDGSFAPNVDLKIAVYIAALAQANASAIDVHPARNLQLSELKTDDNFIFLGSPETDPWFDLYTDQLDFRFVFDEKQDSEFIRNIHPRPNEQSTYLPTAPGWQTGESYATVSFVQNRDQRGQVLLLAGANAEGTEAAGKLTSDLPRLSAELKKCGISGIQIQHFQLLLRLHTMAGSPGDIDVLACHILPEPPTQDHHS